MKVYFLKGDDRVRATEVGKARQASAERRKSKAAHGLQSDLDKDLRINIAGAAAELSAAKALGVEFPGHVDVYKTVPDLPPNWEVRRRASMWMDVLVRADDKDDERLVHVVGDCWNQSVVGWLDIGYWKDRLPDSQATHGGREKAWFFEKKCLTPIGISLWTPDHMIAEVTNGECRECGKGKAIVVNARPGVERLDCLRCGRFIRFITLRQKELF